MKKHIPNFITLVNLFTGCCALVCLLSGQILLGCYFLLIGGIADYLDGFIARLLKVKSNLGKELDSLADMVSFGVVPGTIFYILLYKSMESSPTLEFNWTASIGFLFSIFACLRLAKFNIDTRQEESFLGLPTPAATLFTVGLLFIYYFNSFGLQSFILQPIFLISCVLLFSLLMIVEVPMFSFKFQHFKWKGNEIKYIFALTVVILSILFREAAFSMAILLYIIISYILLLIKNSVS